MRSKSTGGPGTRRFHGDDFDDGLARARNDEGLTVGGSLDETREMGLGFVHVECTHDLMP